MIDVCTEVRLADHVRTAERTSQPREQPRKKVVVEEEKAEGKFQETSKSE